MTFSNAGLRRPTPTRRRTIGCLVVGSLAVGSLAGALVGPTEVSAKTATTVKLSYTGNGTVRGLDFSATGSGRMTPYGSVDVKVRNDPPTSHPVGGDATHVVIEQTTSHIMTLRNGSIFGKGTDRFTFELLLKADGTPVLGDDGNPIPDLSKVVTAASNVVVIGGTGTYARATGSMRLTGTITPNAAPADPTAPLAVRFSFSGSGKGVLPKSGGGTTPLVISDTPPPTTAAPTTAAPTTTVAPITELTKSGVALPGTYFVETNNWRFTIKLGDGWAVNGRDGGSFGMLHNFQRANFSGLVFLDDPKTFADVAKPSSGSIVPVPNDVGAWLRSIPGMNVISTQPFSVGSLAGTEFKAKFAPTGDQAKAIGLYSVGSFGAVPLPYGPEANQILQAVVFEVNGARTIVGFGGGSEDPTQPLKDLLVSVARK